MMKKLLILSLITLGLTSCAIDYNNDFIVGNKVYVRAGWSRDTYFGEVVAVKDNTVIVKFCEGYYKTSDASSVTIAEQGAHC